MKKKYIFTKAKRKEAVARCVLEYPGKGIVRYNKMLVDTIQNKFLRELIKEPLYLAGDLAKKVNIRVNLLFTAITGVSMTNVLYRYYYIPPFQNCSQKC